MVKGGKIGYPTQVTAEKWSTPIRKQKVAEIDNREPLFITRDTTQRSSVTADSEAPAWKRLISLTLLPHEIISLIEVIFASRDEVQAICVLHGDDAQTFIDVIHGVCFLFLPSSDTT